MSRLFPDRLLIGLAPSAVTVQRLSGVLRERVAEKRILACEPGSGAPPWQGALAALGAVQLPAACRATVVLSNHFVRYALVPWNDALSGEAEETAYLRHHFSRIHGERAKAWALRASEGPGGAPRLASAVDAALFAGLRELFAGRARPKLISVQPYLMAALNRWRRTLPAEGAWLVLAEPGRACVTLHARGWLRCVQSANDAWLPALERERHRLGGELPAVVFVAGTPAPACGGNWRFRELAMERSALACAA